MHNTARFQLPFILPGQAQKELYHNESLSLIDAALHPAVEEGPLAAPPPTPGIGQSWIVAGGATGDWAGKEQRLAVWTEGGWRFVAPPPGMLAWNKQDNQWHHWNGTGWSDGELVASGLMIGGEQVIGERQPSVPSPYGGTVIDEEARSAIDTIIATLMSHGLID